MVMHKKKAPVWAKLQLLERYKISVEMYIFLVGRSMHFESESEYYVPTELDIPKSVSNSRQQRVIDLVKKRYLLNYYLKDAIDSAITL